MGLNAYRLKGFRGGIADDAYNAIRGSKKIQEMLSQISFCFSFRLPMANCMVLAMRGKYIVKIPPPLRGLWFIPIPTEELAVRTNIRIATYREAIFRICIGRLRLNSSACLFPEIGALMFRPWEI